MKFILLIKVHDFGENSDLQFNSIGHYLNKMKDCQKMDALKMETNLFIVKSYKNSPPSKILIQLNFIIFIQTAHRIKHSNRNNDVHYRGILKIRA